MSDLKPLRYFQSLNISSNAASIAAFILFSINRMISAAQTDFSSFSFFFWVFWGGLGVVWGGWG